MSYAHDVPGGAAWSAPVRAGRLVTLTGLGADANATVLIYAADRLDRLNVPDTMKSQMSACVRPPMVLMSDRGLALASVVSSTCDWHDCLTGFGHDARPGLLSELAKHGLGEADVHAPVNFFTRVGVLDDAQASLAWVGGHTVTGDEVVLRTEQDVLLVLSTAAHPMSTTGLRPAGVRVAVAVAPPVTDDDPSGSFRDESARALEMTRRVLV